MTVVAGKTIRGDCSNFCISDFKKKCTVETRSLSDQAFGTTAPGETFTVLSTAYFFIQTINGTSRFSGVNTVKGTTHLFLTRWRSLINDLDGVGGHFLRYSGKLYRVLKITNIDEANRFILFHCDERGIDTNEETHA